MSEDKGKKKTTTVGACGKGYEARKGFAITGDYINNQPIFCSTMQQARELFCTIAADKHCLKANVYFSEYEKDDFLELVKNGKYRQAMEFWNELVCEDELRIIKGTMIVPSYSSYTTHPSTGSSAPSARSPKPVTGTVVANDGSKKPEQVQPAKSFEQLAEMLSSSAAPESQPSLPLSPESTPANDKGGVVA